ncbi:hypothetical protein Tco_0991743 [Tanacetum coccineum]|uniref:Uncharacterized protein n=1 Tax=Tanacetum coccineum TaxID=301880 RepID=A0ABQ5F166_9ASTR
MAEENLRRGSMDRKAIDNVVEAIKLVIKRLRRQETPWIVGDNSARSEPTEVADSNDFKPLLKEKRLKEQTNVVVEKKTYTWNKEGKEYSRKECGKHVRKTRRNNNNENRNKQLVCFGGNKKQNCFARLRTRGTLLVKEVERIPREEKQSRIVCEEGKR